MILICWMAMDVAIALSGFLQHEPGVGKEWRQNCLLPRLHERLYNLSVPAGNQQLLMQLQNWWHSLN